MNTGLNAKGSPPMGIGPHALYFLTYLRRYGSFQNTITIGRQRMHVNTTHIRKALKRSDLPKGDFCEELFSQHFDASTIDSIDYSAFEGANVIHDLNIPIPNVLVNTYHTVIDSGCLEHVFNITLALANCSSLCSPGGQIVHILPADNFCGHGFWQLSPELFFSLYSPNNGYAETEVFLASASDEKHWFKVAPPKNGGRATFSSTSPVHVLVRTVKIGDIFAHQNVQQSDYRHAWSVSSEQVSFVPPETDNYYPIAQLKRILRSVAWLDTHFLLPTYRLWRNFQTKRTHKLNKNNPSLTRIDIQSLLNSSA